MDAFATLPDVAVLARRAETLIAAGRTGAARPLLAAVRRMASTAPVAPQIAGAAAPTALATLAARLALREGQLGEAHALLDPAIEAAPADAGLRKLRAELHARLDDLPGAAADAAEAVMLDPADPVAKALLGGALLDLGRPAEAAACLKEAVAAAPGNPYFRHGLAAALLASDATDAATDMLTKSIAACPDAIALRKAAIVARLQQQDFSGAMQLADAARSAGLVDATLLALRGQTLACLGRHEEAADARRQALALEPQNLELRHLVAASILHPEADRASETFLHAVFDGCAHHFDTHILQLGYRAPGLIRAELVRYAATIGDATGGVLDLGCGTGLVALACSDLHVGCWTGVDASPGMLAEAHGKALYAALHEQTIDIFLDAGGRRWRVIVAGDVLCYFGTLDPVLSRIAARLEAGGTFVATFEGRVSAAGAGERTAPAWARGRDGRFSHDAGYVIAAGQRAGLHVRCLRPEPMRRAARVAVPGFIVVFEPAARHV